MKASKTQQKAERKDFFVRGRKIKLESGEDGVYLEKGKGKGVCHWVLVGGQGGGKRTIMNESLVAANFPDHE